VAGATVATIEAMKMEPLSPAPVGGTVARLPIGAVQQVERWRLCYLVSN